MSAMVSRYLSWIFRVCGIAPCDSTADKYYTILALFLSISTFLHVYLTFPIFLDALGHNLVCAYLIMSLLSSLSLPVQNVCCRSVYESLLRNLQAVDQELGTNSVMMQQGIIFFLSTFGLIFQSLLIATSGSSLLCILECIVGYVQFYCPLIQHILLVCLLHDRFTALNDLLTAVAADLNISPLPKISSQMDSIFRLHSELHYIVGEINSLFCFYNLFNTTVKMCYVLFQMYIYLLSVAGYQDNLSLVVVGVGTVQVASFLAQVLVCHACAREANRTVLIAHRSLQPDTPAQLWEQVGQFSALTVDNKVRFSVAGIFSLDRALITKVAVMSLSYLIIAVQLKDVSVTGNPLVSSEGNTTLSFR